MAIRTYECPDHGVFELNCSVHEPTGPRPCPACGIQSDYVFVTPPVFGVKGSSPLVPNDSKVAGEYEGWQRETYAKWKEVGDSIGAPENYKGLRHYTERTR